MFYQEIDFTKNFLKQFDKLRENQKTRFYEHLEIFKINPHDKVLRNHALKGKYLGYRSIDITGDIRALYTVKGDIVIIFGFIGTHSQLYK